MYKTFITTATAFIFISSILCSQNNPGILFSLQKLPDQSWGVFIKPDEGILPSERTLAATGQVTIVAPANFKYSNFVIYSGKWIENARVDNPREALGKSYISFGFISNEPQMQIAAGEETLLFTFITDELFNKSLRLIDNNNDPFLFPNSFSSNPGNDISIADIGLKSGIKYYKYSANYFSKNSNKPIFANQKKPNESTKTGADGMVIQWLEEENEKQ